MVTPTPTLAQAHQGVFAWMAARAAGRTARLPWPELAWLGLDFQVGELEPVPVGPLQGGPSLGELKREGYLGVAVLSYLAEIGWRNPEEHVLQSKPEMLLSFRVEDLAPDPVAFDPARLDEVQAVFALELTPAELVDGTLASWRALLGADPTAAQRRDLEALALLYGPEVHLLPDFPRLAGFYARPPETPAAPVALHADPWDAPELEEALAGLSSAEQEAVATAVTGSPTTPGLAEVLALLGREKVLGRLRR